MQQTPVLAETGVLAAARIGIVAEPTSEIEAIEWALFRAGAEVQMLPRSYLSWPGDPDHDLVIVQVAPQELDGGARAARESALEALASWQRVIALVDSLEHATARGVRDFVAAPFPASEVLARANRVLRELVPDVVLTAGNLELSVTSRQVTVGGVPLSVTYNEFEVLRALLVADGGVVSRESVAHSSGNMDPNAIRAVDIHIHRLRAKLGALKGTEIETVRRVGYRMSRHLSGR